MSLVPILLALPLVAAADAPYTLDGPGVTFEWLPAELSEPVEGEMTATGGTVVSGPTSDGVEFSIRYWQEDIPVGEARADWISTRLSSLLPPDLGNNLLMGNVQWIEGSQATSCRSGTSMGLMPCISYNIIRDSGAILGRGRAYASFRRGYAVLVMATAPAPSAEYALGALDSMVASMHLTEEED